MSKGLCESSTTCCPCPSGLVENLATMATDGSGLRGLRSQGGNQLIVFCHSKV
ncbi:hypothetical protein M378DRAFT_165871 [Amanita muscaria Koide BX008]|uniref:Uncharacterized protein n=1 Tax=Amanita muscaria (strain Koide BX008) TaxID=946122 RepID=A0A0C2WL89_AMAMK|nr:hypothetical protein M378DRAFT_165871 [Amanita muscaria Koide BX008]